VLIPNDATLIGAFGGATLGAVIGGIVSLFVARYTVKRSANYSGQIHTINEALASLAATQEEMRQQHAAASEAEAQRDVERERKAEAAQWKLEARIESKVEGIEQVNKLVLKSSQSFFLTAASLIAPSGAKLLDCTVMPDVPSTGFSVPITHASLNKVAELSPTFFHQETFSGSFRYSVQREKDGVSYTSDIAFHGERVYLQSACYYKLSG
jgi:hypothetical protein